MNDFSTICSIITFIGVIYFAIKCYLLKRRLRKERAFRNLIITSHERFRRDLLAAGKLDAGAFKINRPHVLGETGDVELPLGANVEYAGEWTPSPLVFFSKKDPAILTFVLETDLTDLDADLSRVDGFDLILRPFTKPVRDDALEKGHVRLWLVRKPGVTQGHHGSDGGDDAANGADNQK